MKSEVLWLGSSHQLSQISITDIPLQSTMIRVIESARDLGVIDSKLSLSAHMWRPFVSLVSTTCAKSAQCSDYWHTQQPEHSSGHSYQVAWTIVIHCSVACLTASSAKFSSSRMPLLGFSLELDDRTTSRQFCVSCTGFLSRDMLTSSWHVSFTRLCLATHLRTWLTTYTWFLEGPRCRLRLSTNRSCAVPCTHNIWRHKLCCCRATCLEQPQRRHFI